MAETDWLIEAKLEALLGEPVQYDVSHIFPTAVDS
jgi:hypothetical protein